MDPACGLTVMRLTTIIRQFSGSRPRLYW